ncbi:MAG: SdrD B-like domain-containing protein [Anaerolineales bacterium]
MSKLMKFTFKLLDLMVIFVMAFGSPMAALAQEAGPTLATDKTNYALGEIISISGNGFVAGSYSLIATYPDGTTMEWGPVTVDESLLFAATSPAVTAEGDYSLAVYNEGSDTVIASVDFKVTIPIPEPTIEPTAQPTAEPTVEPPATPTPEPIIQSDKADYAPGEAVTLTGRFWQAGETIRIFVNDDIWNSWYHDASINADDAGTFTYTFQLPNWFVATYSVKATGSVSGLVTTSFTDSQEDYKHYADKSPANWQNGALQSTNSQYFEGEVVPHYWKTELLTPGQTYGINIYYDYFDTSSGGYCGFDYLTQYNISRYPPAVGSSPYPIASLPGVSGSLFTVGAGNVSTSGPYNAGIQRFIQVRFIAATSKVEFYWGLHLAQPGVISGCQGSKAWPGASLQSDVRAVPQFTQYMLGGGGSMQINPSAVIRGTISGFKWNDLDGDGAVDGNESKLSGWTIRLCYDSGCTGVIQTTTTDASGNYNFNVAPGTYFVREVQQPGWSQTWTPSGYYGPLTITATTPTYSNMNFGNRQGSSITIVKDAVPNDPQDFPFYGTFGGFLLDDDSDPNVSNSRTYSNLSPGVYTVGENPMGYWDFSGIKCTGDNGNTIVYPGSTQVQIYLDAGENIVCTFTNTKRGTIIINKFTSGGDGTFGFTTTGGNSFPSSFNITTVNGSGSQTFSNVAAGAYSISETTLQGWDLTKAACSTGTPDSFTVEPGGTVTCSFTNMLQMGTLIVKKVVVNDNGGSKGFSDFSFKVNGATAIPFEEDGQNNLNINAGTYTVTESAVAGYTTTYDNCTDVIVPAGGSATCTITNDDQPGTLIVKKVVVNNNGGTLEPENFTFAVNGEAPIAFEADGENTLTVDAGTYTVTEPVVAGYTTTYENCTDVVVPNGGTVTCTITNNDNAGTLIVKKIVINDNGGTLKAENFTFAVNGGDDIAFEEDGENQLTVNAGTYTVTEPTAAGYTATYNNCSNIVIANGGSATCTITNNDQPGTLIVKKVVVNDNGGTLTAKDFSFVVNDMATMPFENDGQNDLIVDAGVYTVIETPAAGYTTTYSNCDDVIVPNGGSQTCVITNDDQAGTIIVEKQTDPDGLAGEFIFTGDAAGTISDNGQIVVSGLSAGTYTSTEVVPAGWQLTGISCNDTNSTGDVASSTATFNLENGETVKCVFTNDPLPTVTLTKTASPQSLPEPGGVFTFTLVITNTSVENVQITGLGEL